MGGISRPTRSHLTSANRTDRARAPLTIKPRCFPSRNTTVCGPTIGDFGSPWLATRFILPPTITRVSGRSSMRLLRFGVLIALVLACNSLMLAFDPVIHVDDPQGPGTPVGLSFTFTSDGSGGGLLNFDNTSGVTFVNLQIDVPPPLPIAPITCDGNAYVHCFQQSFTIMGFATLHCFGGPGLP